MAALTSQSIVGGAGGTTPAVITAALTDTIAEGQFGPNGCILRVITAGTISNISISDPGATPSGNAGTVVALAAPATGVRMIPIPRAAINPNTGVATVTASSITALTYELYRV